MALIVLLIYVLFRSIFIFLPELQFRLQNSMTRFLFSILFLFSCILLSAQTGGQHIWAFLNTPVTSRITALGGQQISIFDDDVSLVHFNPSLLNSSMSNHLSLSYADYLADIRYDYITYARTFNNIGNFGLGIHHIDYGEFKETDVYGNILGTFNHVYDYSINAFYSRPILDSLLQIGGTLKAIGSKYEYWNAFGLALDAGITYHNPERLFTAALVMKNLGRQINTYYRGADHEPLPFEIQLGISQKLKHAPFRFSILARNLETPNLQYETEEEQADNTDPFTGEATKENKLASFGDNMMRHVVFGVEFLPLKSFSFRIGYNYRRREELKIPDKTGAAGFSWGFGLKIYKFHINYARARYHLAAVTNHFTLSINLNEFSNKY